MVAGSRGNPGRLRGTTAFGLSASVHGFLLGWLILATPTDLRPAKSIYDQEIRPHEEHLVWYNLRDRLPDVSPSADAKDGRPPRAHHKFNQVLVAGHKDNPLDRQMIRMPEPKVAPAKVPPLPNVLAVAMPRPERTFVAPPTPKTITAPVPSLPEPPKPAAPLMDIPDYKPALPLPPRKRFTPPPQSRTAVKPAAALPEAPQAAVVPLDVPEYKSALPLPPHREFTLPTAKRGSAAAPVLPDAPAVNAPVVDAAAPPPRAFTPPQLKPVATAAALPDAPAASAMPVAPPSPSVAIAGLDPAKMTDLPKPPGSQDAHFSAGPELRPKGGADAAGGMVVPGLMARGGTPTPSIPTVAPGTTTTGALQRPKFMDPLHPLDGVLPPAEPHATRVSNAPDPLLEGRVIYTMAIQMPNVTSYSGSWMVWFAERASLGNPADMQPPEPLRKVDPKYVATAAAERIEGKVRLSAIIRKNGSVDSVVLLRHLDPRLDQTAEEALSKWIFQPARRNGVPIDVDAVFEIPFFLAPKPVR